MSDWKEVVSDREEVSVGFVQECLLDFVAELSV